MLPQADFFILKLFPENFITHNFNILNLKQSNDKPINQSIN